MSEQIMLGQWDVLKTTIEMYGITIVIAMLSAGLVHGIAKIIVALGIDSENQPAPALAPAPASVAAAPAGDSVAMAVAIAAAKRFHDTH